MQNMKFFTFIIIFLIIILFSASVNAQGKYKKKITNKSLATNIIQKKELVYLFTSNGGMVGYYSDGTVVACPRCDFSKSNILAMCKKKPMGKWNLKKPDDFISYEEDNGWVLINYKWKEKVPQF